jgi:hypothetical protein
VNKAPVSPRNSIPNEALEREINLFLDQNPELFEDDIVYLPVSWLFQLINAILCDHRQEISTLLALDKRLYTYPIYEDYTAFHYACEFGSYQTTLCLFNCFDGNYDKLLQIPRPQDWQPKHLNDLLAEACNSKGFDAVETLLNLGADPDDLSAQASPQASCVTSDTWRERSQHSFAVDQSSHLSEVDAATSGVAKDSQSLSSSEDSCRQQEAISSEATQLMRFIHSLIDHQNAIVAEKDSQLNKMHQKLHRAEQEGEALIQENHQLKRKIAQLESKHARSNPPSLAESSTQAGYFKSGKRARVTFSASVTTPIPVSRPTFGETLAWLDNLPSVQVSNHAAQM